MGCAGSTLAMPLEQRVDQLRKTPFLLSLNEADLQELASIFTIRKFACGEELPESNFYVVVDGSVSVMAGDKKLCSKPEGSFFSRNFRDITESAKSTKVFN